MPALAQLSACTMLFQAAVIHLPTAPPDTPTAQLLLPAGCRPYGLHSTAHKRPRAAAACFFVPQRAAEAAAGREGRLLGASTSIGASNSTSSCSRGPVQWRGQRPRMAPSDTRTMQQGLLRAHPAPHPGKRMLRQGLTCALGMPESRGYPAFQLSAAPACLPVALQPNWPCPLHLPVQRFGRLGKRAAGGLPNSSAGSDASEPSNMRVRAASVLAYREG